MHKKPLLHLLTLIILFTLSAPARAQDTAALWGEPLNVSRSGAAAAPRLLAGPDGTVQAFWLDEFDGLMTAFYDGQAWSDPLLATLLISNEPLLAEDVDLGELGFMPTLAAGADGWVHAFWFEDGEPNNALLTSRLAFGSNAWSSPEIISEKAVAFTVKAAPSGTATAGALAVAYYRSAHSQQASAGLYLKQLSAGGAAWGASTVIYPSVYFRKLDPAEANLSLEVPGDGRLFLAWEDARLGLALSASSPDNGRSWSAVEELARPDPTAGLPVFASLPGGGLLRLWTIDLFNGCRVYQQTGQPGVAAPIPTATPTPRPTPTPRRRQATAVPTPVEIPATPQVASGAATPWSEVTETLPGLSACPQGGAFYTQGARLLWAWGQDTAALHLAAFDPAAQAWSQPASFSFQFSDPETTEPIGLSDLDFALAGERLFVIGSDPTGGDVWVLAGQASALELSAAEPSPWNAAQPIAGSQLASGLALALDSQGAGHLVWSLPAGGETSAALAYARLDAGGPSTPVEVFFAGEGEVMRQPALLSGPGEWLHLAWSGATRGQILYSRAAPGDAAFSGGWQAPRAVSPAAGAHPQLAHDAAGNLYLLYIVPANEGRGVYLVSSADQGETWSEPELVFDAQAAGWEMLDHPALAVAPDGSLLAAWVQAALPGGALPQGIWYSTALTSDLTGGAGASLHRWSPAATLAGRGYDFPRLAVSSGQVTLLAADLNGGGLSARQAALPLVEDSWGAATRLPGLDAAAVPVGLAVSGPALSALDSADGGAEDGGAEDGGALHVAAALADGSLAYTTWDGRRWSGVEQVHVAGEQFSGRMAVAATRPEGGALAAAWLALPLAPGDDGDQPQGGLFTALRALPRLEIPDEELLPTAAATATPGAVAVTPSPAPTATPDLNAIPPASGPPLPALMLGGLVGILAGLLFVGSRFLIGKGR